MVEPTASHCSVSVNLSHVAITGGKGMGANAMKSLHMLNVVSIGPKSGSESWIVLPDMNVARFGHACGVSREQESSQIHT